MSEVGKYAHGEAFMLMWYECPCGHRETIWNSRDGVTPFAMSCPSCGDASLRHLNWKADYLAPDHVPHPGQGIWRDGTPDEAEAFIRKRLAKCIGTPYELPPERVERLVAICRDPDSPDNTEFRRGWPMFVREGVTGQ